MRLHTIVALTDFSPATEHALERAALLASAHGAQLRILFAADGPVARFDDPQARLVQRARHLSRRHGLPVQALPPEPDGAADGVLRAAAQADLLVLDARMRRGWRSLWHGSLLMRMLRRSPCPVLVVREAPCGAYGHVLVDVDFSLASRAVVRYAGELQDSATIELFHGADRREPSVAQAYRQDVRLQARQRRVRLSDAFHARRNRVAMTTGTQDAVQQLVVQQQRTGADLLVLGGLPPGLVRSWWQGRRVRRLLGGVDCDVLVCRPQQAGGELVARGAALHAGDVGVAVGRAA
ncbi:universal stress protein [Alicycliphilus denitrificans]|uniref:UspA domain-containing protein n=2 Tax=Alicycliphilus denitrificans TaxID=179636 RepID=F4GGM0_ALIDK|nr:universal stress protein [Alicycliphilus denitrificans]ADV01235.1 UspA domain-containing protein [Alicycliphilus denitrificans BC]AEB86245.1 UspA domain-containing protein [Alicycliphilus denitrificans K601]QKD45378.1 universal stress protein [Alicycliphilus denitrificans]GAO24859.1 UspA domain-containing protein [Alicycliphilus sp. B1]